MTATDAESLANEYDRIRQGCLQLGYSVGQTSTAAKGSGELALRAVSNDSSEIEDRDVRNFDWTEEERTNLAARRRGHSCRVGRRTHRRVFVRSLSG